MKDKIHSTYQIKEFKNKFLMAAIKNKQIEISSQAFFGMNPPWEPWLFQKKKSTSLAFLLSCPFLGGDQNA